MRRHARSAGGHSPLMGDGVCRRCTQPWWPKGRVGPRTAKQSRGRPQAGTHTLLQAHGDRLEAEASPLNNNIRNPPPFAGITPSWACRAGGGRYCEGEAGSSVRGRLSGGGGGDDGYVRRARTDMLVGTGGGESGRW